MATRLPTSAVASTPTGASAKAVQATAAPSSHDTNKNRDNGSHARFRARLFGWSSHSFSMFHPASQWLIREHQSPICQSRPPSGSLPGAPPFQSMLDGWVATLAPRRKVALFRTSNRVETRTLLMRTPPAVVGSEACTTVQDIAVYLVDGSGHGVGQHSWRGTKYTNRAELPATGILSSSAFARRRRPSARK